jgi:branched-chain amino acid transport system permease protein
VLVVLLVDEEYRRSFVSGPGIVKGAMIAAIGLGLVLTYTGSGVVNFANGAIAMLAAYVYAGLRSDGDLLLPPLPNPLAPIEGILHQFQDRESWTDLPDLPTRVSFGPNMQVAPAVLLTLLFSLLLGAALYWLVFRPLRSAPALAKVVASVGVLLLVQSIIIRRFGVTARTVPKLYDKQPKVLDLPFGLTMTREQLVVVVLVLVLTAVLWAAFRLTRFGLATRAAAENEKGSILLGFSPDFLAGSNWVLSTMLAGLVGMFVASAESSVDPVTITFLVLPALSAALVGGFTSFWVTTLTAFLLGMSGPIIGYLGVNESWFPKSAGQPIPGVASLLPFLVIVVVLFLRGNALPMRGSITTGRLPFAPTPGRTSMLFVGPAVGIVTALVILFLATPNGRLAIVNTLVGTVIALSFVVLTGFVGQISLAQMVLAGISGFILSKLTVEHSIPFPISPLIGALGATAVGLLVGIPALRVRGVSLAIVTFAFAVAMQEFLFKNPSINGGLNGARINSPEALDPLNDVPFDRGQGANPWFGIFCLVVVMVLAYAVANLRRSATGRSFIATRSNERAAAAAGVGVASTKITAFGVSSFIAGLAGALSAYRFGNVTQEYFGNVQSLTFFAFAYLGGIASVSGAVAAGLIMANGVMFTIMQTWFHVPVDFTLILGGLGLILTAILNPEGIAGGYLSKYRDRRARKDAAATKGAS